MLRDILIFAIGVASWGIPYWLLARKQVEARPGMPITGPVVMRKKNRRTPSVNDDSKAWRIENEQG